MSVCASHCFSVMLIAFLPFLFFTLFRLTEIYLLLGQPESKSNCRTENMENGPDRKDEEEEGHSLSEKVPVIQGKLSAHILTYFVSFLSRICSFLTHF